MNPQKLIPMDRITISPRNPRRVDPNDTSLTELAESIAAVGLLHPVLVRPLKKGEYELLAGQRRFLASRRAKATEIAATIADMNDEEALEVMITENLQRHDLTPLEEGRAVASLLETRDVSTVAGILAKSVSWCRRRAQLASLSPAWLTALEGTLVEQGDEMAAAQAIRPVMTAGHLEVVAHFPPAVQDDILRKMKDSPYARKHSLEGFKSFVGDFTRQLKDAPWDLASIEYGGSCADCPSRSDREPDLFRGVCEQEDDSSIEEPHCLNLECFKEKYAAFIAARKAAAEKKTKQAVLTVGGNNYYSNAPKPDLNHWKAQEAKKGDAGAVPAIRTDGPDAGKLVYVIPPQASTAPGREKQSPESAANKVKRLRAYHIATALNTWLDKQDELPPALNTMPRLLAALVLYGCEPEYPPKLDTYASFLDGEDASDALFAMAWQKLKDGMRNDIGGYDAGRLDLACEVLGLEKQPFEDAAALAFPDPEPTEKPAKGKKGGAK